MFYSPHTLQKKTMALTRDNDGLVSGTAAEEWSSTLPCRCDNDGVTELVDGNGRVYRASYHIILARTDSLCLGDYIRVNEKSCEGEVRRINNTNYLEYTEIWI